MNNISKQTMNHNGMDITDIMDTNTQLFQYIRVEELEQVGQEQIMLELISLIIIKKGAQTMEVDMVS